MSNSSMKDVTALRATLFDTIDGIKNKSISLDQAKVINDLSQTIINSAKVEVEHLRTVKATHGSGFIPALVDKQEGSDDPVVNGFGTYETTNGTVTRAHGRTVHKLR